MQFQEVFRKWLKETKRKKNGTCLIESTIDCYVSTIGNISDDMMQLGVIDKSLFNVISSFEMDNLANLIKNNNEFINKNFKGHNRHTCALEHYIEFVHNM